MVPFLKGCDLLTFILIKLENYYVIMCVCIYIYTHTHLYIYLYICICQFKNTYIFKGILIFLYLSESHHSEVGRSPRRWASPVPSPPWDPQMTSAPVSVHPLV